MKIIATLFLSLLLPATQAQQVTFENTKDKVRLAGSLNLPGPAGRFPAVKCPVLVLIGSKDLRVPPVPHLKAWQQDLKKAGHRDVTVREMPGINHMLQRCVSCKETEYGTLPETISPALMEVVGKWMQQKAGVNGRGGSGVRETINIAPGVPGAGIL